MRKTSSGTLRLVAKLVPDSVCWRRPRASLNSSTSSALASMMKPRSAPVTSIAESSTSASTSSSTRPLPSARRPSSSAAICRRSPIAVVVALSCAGAVSASRKTSSAPPVRPSRMRSPCDERPLGDRLVVDVRAVARLLVADQEYAVGREDLGVIARDFAAGQPQIVGLPAADAEGVLLDRHDAAAQSVGDLEAGVRHGGSLSNGPSTRTGRRRNAAR